MPLLVYTHIFRGKYQGLLGLSRALTLPVSLIFLLYRISGNGSNFSLLLTLVISFSDC